MRGARAARGAAAIASRDAAPDINDALTARYRHIARALAVPPAPGLDADSPPKSRGLWLRACGAGHRLLARLLRALLLALALSSAVVVALYGVQWWRASAQLFGTDTLGWTIAVAACAALSWSLEWMRRRGADDRADPTPV